MYVILDSQKFLTQIYESYGIYYFVFVKCTLSTYFIFIFLLAIIDFQLLTFFASNLFLIVIIVPIFIVRVT